MKSEKKNKKIEKKKVVEAEIIEKKEEKKAAKKSKKSKNEGFFKNVIKELKKVKWPDKKYMVKYATATFATIIISSLYFYAIFALFSYLKGLV